MTLLAGPSSPPLNRLVRAELHRVLSPKPVRYAVGALPLVLLALAVSAYLGHHTDVASAWRSAEAAYRAYAEEAASPAGSVETLSPREFFDDPRYLMAKASFVDLRAVLSGLSLAVLVFGILSGGADWSSRVMLTLAAAEPRRSRLFLTRGLLVTGVATAAAVLTTVFFVPLLLVVAQFKGSLAETDGRYWAVLAVVGARGAVLVGLVALLGYGLAMLTRRTATALGIALAYLVAALPRRPGVRTGAGRVRVGRDHVRRPQRAAADGDGQDDVCGRGGLSGHAGGHHRDRRLPRPVRTPGARRGGGLVAVRAQGRGLTWAEAPGGPGPASGRPWPPWSAARKTFRPASRRTA